MKKFIFFFLFVFCLSIVPIVKIFSQDKVVCPHDSKQIQFSISEKDLKLWKKFVGELAQQDIWNQRDAADSSEIMMVPLHFAYRANFQEGISDFQKIMSRFSRSELPGGQLNQASWVYLVSQYLSLKTDLGLQLTVDDQVLLRRIQNWTFSAWYMDPDFQWEAPPFSGISQRFKSITKLPIDESQPSYYNAITDYELFVMAISADLIFMKNCSTSFDDYESQEKQYIQLKSEFDFGLRLVKSRWKKVDSNLLFQPGTWSDHPDYIYAGNSDLKSNLSPLKVRLLPEDSSHSHRWPLWLRSFQTALEPEGRNYAWVESIIRLNSKQFKNKVVHRVNNSIYLNNYMDGHNGVYRYDYETTGSNQLEGYGPFMLSGVLGSSWYPFSCGVADIFEDYLGSYPLEDQTLKTYVGPNTSRNRNLLYSWPNFFSSGFSELIASQASALATLYENCSNADR
jgi:hypothetical protein